VSDRSTGRMLLSHNFNLRNNELPALNREEFAQVFIDGLQGKEIIKCGLIDNPHWVVEIVFPTDQFEPKEIGQICGDILISKRKSQQLEQRSEQREVALRREPPLSKLRKKAPSFDGGVISESKTAIDTLILGGRKTSPATDMSPNSLQIGEWGVDVVETIQAHIFLEEIAWEQMTASRPSDGIFKIEFLKD
jgi:hypothetical protein